MAKDSVTSPIAPLFSLARTLLDEADRQADRFVEYGISQQKEVNEVVKTLRTQMMGISRTVLETVEQTSAAALDTARSYNPFHKAQP